MSWMCKNFANCGNHVAKPGLCDQCKREAEELSALVDEQEEQEYMERSSGKNLEEQNGE